MRMMLIKENMLQDTRDGKLGCFVFVLPIFISTGRAAPNGTKTSREFIQLFLTCYNRKRFVVTTIGNLVTSIGKTVTTTGNMVTSREGAQIWRGIISLHT